MVVIFGVIMLIVAPRDSSRYVTVPAGAIAYVTELAAMLVGVWVATLEFSAGAMQRTLIAEPDRRCVLVSKLTLTVAVSAIGGVAVAAATGGRGGIALSLALILVVGGVLGFIPTAERLRLIS